MKTLSADARGSPAGNTGAFSRSAVRASLYSKLNPSEQCALSGEQNLVSHTFVIRDVCDQIVEIYRHCKAREETTKIPLDYTAVTLAQLNQWARASNVANANDAGRIKSNYFKVFHNFAENGRNLLENMSVVFPPRDEMKPEITALVELSAAMATRAHQVPTDAERKKLLEKDNFYKKDISPSSAEYCVARLILARNSSKSNKQHKGAPLFIHSIFTWTKLKNDNEPSAEGTGDAARITFAAMAVFAFWFVAVGL